MIWLLVIGGALFVMSLCAIASRSDKRIAAMHLERVHRLHRVACGTATKQDYTDTTLYEMEHITFDPDFATFCERNGFRV